MVMISERSKRMIEAVANSNKRATRIYRLCYAFSTFFIIKLFAQGFNGVSTYTRRIDLFKFELAFISIHVNNNHWCLLIRSLYISRTLIH